MSREQPLCQGGLGRSAAGRARARAVLDARRPGPSNATFDGGGASLAVVGAVGQRSVLAEEIAHVAHRIDHGDDLGRESIVLNGTERGRVAVPGHSAHKAARRLRLARRMPALGEWFTTSR